MSDKQIIVNVLTRRRIELEGLIAANLADKREFERNRLICGNRLSRDAS